MALLFSDCRTTEVLFGRRTAWAERALMLAAAGDDAEERDLLQLAAVLLARQGFDPGEHRDGRVPRSWFLNLEMLFETAVERILGQLLQPSARLTHGKRNSVFVFSDVGYLKAEPDLVIREQAGEVVVGDVKYKDLSGAADPSDLYQLLAHARAYGARRAFLVYPGEQFSVKCVGGAFGEIDVHTMVLDVRALDRDLSSGLSAIRVLP
jgi:5-methylcytosine-specific restriction endonuclease McrBC regulatory subunit McrC